MLFPAITVWLAIFLVFVYEVYLRTGDRVYLQLFRFWKKIFAVGFALGCCRRHCDHFRVGAELGVVCPPRRTPSWVRSSAWRWSPRFFVEAGFIGIMLYSDGRVSPWVMFTTCCLVALGAVLSTTWILLANSWMQTPAQYRLVGGQFQPTDWVHASSIPHSSGAFRTCCWRC